MSIKQDIEKVVEDVEGDVDDAARTLIQKAAAIGANVAGKVEDVAGDVKEGAAKLEQKASDLKIKLENIADGIIITEDQLPKHTHPLLNCEDDLPRQTH